MKQKAILGGLFGALALFICAAIWLLALPAFEVGKSGSRTEVTAASQPAPSKNLVAANNCVVCGSSAYAIRSAEDFALLVNSTESGGGGSGNGFLLRSFL